MVSTERTGLGRVFRLHRPLLRVVASSTLSFLLLASLHFDALVSAPAPALALALAAGVAYTQLFEYAYHRYGMHRLRGALARSHLEHHRIFHGDDFATRSESDLEHVAGRWYLFPACFALHFALARTLVSAELAVAFLGGALVHYLFFEVTHWFAHVEDNLLDRALGRVPILRTLRAFQLAHHREHHERPDVDFNFNPPYLGDRLGGTLRVSAAVGTVDPRAFGRQGVRSSSSRRLGSGQSGSSRTASSSCTIASGTRPAPASAAP